MQSNKGSGTKPELILASLLRKKLILSELPGRPDFIYPKARLAVFVHGDWWHRNPKLNLPMPRRHRAFWARKFARNVERDFLVKEELEAMGWRVLVVWESEVKADPKGVARRIKFAALQRV
jgi:DNA mismatch endonuclease (patch repair protein)